VKLIHLITLFFLVLFFFPTNVYAQETSEIIKSLTSNKTIVDGQEVTVVYVSIDETSNNTDNGEIMISSAALIGFIGLGSFISATAIGRTTKFEIKLYAIALILVTALIILHLIIMGLAFLGTLSTVFYSVVIIITMFLIGAIVTTLIFMNNSHLTSQNIVHRIGVSTDDAVTTAFNIVKKESKSAVGNYKK